MRTKIIPPMIPVAIQCEECQGYTIRRVKNRIASGAYQVFDLCLDCGKNARGSALYIPHQRAGIPLDKIPLFMDYTSNSPPCYVCGRTDGTELHHFAPQHIFPDAHKWPQEYLCKKHHDEWHVMMAAHIQSGECRYCNGLAAKGQVHG